MRSPSIGRPMEILIVEDEMVSARFAIESLRAGRVTHRVTLVVDGEEALQFLRREQIFIRAPRPDLILLDLYLPSCSGLDVLKAIRADDSLREIPVVIMTASDEAEDVRQCQELGVECYMRKPVDLAQFHTVIKQLRHYLPAELELPEL